MVEWEPMTDFVDWLSAELDQRAWSMSELARRAGISHSLISQVLSEKQYPTPDFVLAVTGGLDADPVYALRLAGHLPPAPPITDLDTQVCQQFRTLSAAHKTAIAHIVSSLAGRTVGEYAPTPTVSRPYRVGLEGVEGDGPNEVTEPVDATGASRRVDYDQVLSQIIGLIRFVFDMAGGGEAEFNRLVAAVVAEHEGEQRHNPHPAER